VVRAGAGGPQGRKEKRRRAEREKLGKGRSDRERRLLAFLLGQSAEDGPFVQKVTPSAPAPAAAAAAAVGRAG